MVINVEAVALAAVALLISFVAAIIAVGCSYPVAVLTSALAIALAVVVEIR